MWLPTVDSLQNFDQLYVLVSSAHKTTRHDLYSVESDIKTINKSMWLHFQVMPSHTQYDITTI